MVPKQQIPVWFEVDSMGAGSLSFSLGNLPDALGISLDLQVTSGLFESRIDSQGIYKTAKSRPSFLEGIALSAFNYHLYL